MVTRANTFSALFQFEREFTAKRLGNWEVPKWYPDRPRGPNKHPTRIIVNDRGHLLPGIHRSTVSPWGIHYTGTWDLPKKITREVANALSAPPAEKVAAWERRSAHAPILLPAQPEGEAPPSKKQLPDRVTDRQTALDEAKNSVPDHDKDNGNDPPDESPLEVTGHPASRSGSRPSSKSSRSSRKPVEVTGRPYEPGEIYIKPDRRLPLVPPATPPNVPGYIDPPPEPERKARRMPSGPPLAKSHSNFQIAKQFHEDNLKHQPLPDTVNDAMYWKMEAQGAKHPGTALDVVPQAAAVGWKGPGVPGASQCSKLRVYRPKTAGVIPEEEGPDPPSPGRPRTSVKRSKLRRQRHVSEMELAICWDLKPGEGDKEPRPAPHIDGSKDSAGPAVFTLVQGEPPADPAGGDCGQPGGCGTNTTPSKASKSPPTDLNSISTTTVERLKARPKTAWSEHGSQALVERLEQLKSVERQTQKENSSPNVPSNGHRKHGTPRAGSGSRGSAKKSSLSSSEIDSVALARRKHYQSSPNLATESKELSNGNCGHEKHSNDGHHKHEHKNHRHKSGKCELDSLPTIPKHKLFHRPCAACDGKTPPMGNALLHRPKSEYKMAFKAGKPSNSFDSASGSNTRPTTAKPMRMPKPKPIVRRSYSIDTLAPPFSLWPGNGAQAYPESWRLASVYQHAYKPIEARKRPLIDSVFQ